MHGKDTGGPEKTEARITNQFYYARFRAHSHHNVFKSADRKHSEFACTRSPGAAMPFFKVMHALLLARSSELSDHSNLNGLNHTTLSRIGLTRECGLKIHVKLYRISAAHRKAKSK